jgi:hypothetical protein
MKHKLDKGIILSWDDYAHNTVSEFLLCFLFYVTILLPPNLYFIQECMWIHHWVILQFVNPLFSVPIHYNLHQVGPNGFMCFALKHNNFDQFVHSVDNELELEHHNCHGEVPPFSLVWLGIENSKPSTQQARALHSIDSFDYQKVCLTNKIFPMV